MRKQVNARIAVAAALVTALFVAGIGYASCRQDPSTPTASVPAGADPVTRAPEESPNDHAPNPRHESN
jgi:hypothetical protein